MDAFNEPFWNLDQVAAWARSRSADAVRYAADERGASGLAIALFVAYESNEAKKEGRDFDEEIRRAGGRTQDSPIDDGTPPFRINGVDMEPLPGNPVPINDYLTHLFRQGRLVAYGRFKGETESREIEALQWSTIEVDFIPPTARLGVRRVGASTLEGDGDIEQVRVESDAVQRFFAALDARSERSTQSRRDDASIAIRVPVMELVGLIAERNGGKRMHDLEMYRDGDDDDYRPVRFSNEDVKLYDDAADELLDAILTNRLPILGQRAGSPGAALETVASEEFTDLRDSVLGEPALGLICGESRYLDLVDGSIRSGRRVFWSGLVARRDDVLANWPVATPAHVATSAKPLARKQNKPETIAAWLKDKYPTRPTISNKELMKIVKKEGPNNLSFGNRTFDHALRIAYR